MNFVIFDTEYTTWQGAQNRRWQGVGEFKEIISIGALKIQYPEFVVLEEFNVFIKPSVNPVLSEYCKCLTKISQAQVDNGLDFFEGYKRFLKFSEGCLITSYGNDFCILAENLILNHADPLCLYGKDSPSFLNLKHWISQTKKDILSYSSGELWKNISVPPKFNHGVEHNALNDCYSILEILHFLYQQKYQLPFVEDK